MRHPLALVAQTLGATFHGIASLQITHGCHRRGTGASGGVFSQDFDLLAANVFAAMREARRMPGARVGRVGYQSGSQGGCRTGRYQS
jgi:hypothetical protein